MRIRLTQAGFQRYNGQMGVINFVDGLSTADVRQIDAVRMAAVMGCEWENGSSPSVAQSLLDNAHTPAPTPEQQRTADQAKVNATQPVPEASGQPQAPKYTQESLAAIADKEGIKGLRAIGDPLGVKANSIKELVAAILNGGK